MYEDSGKKEIVLPAPPRPPDDVPVPIPPKKDEKPEDLKFLLGKFNEKLDQTDILIRDKNLPVAANEYSELNAIYSKILKTEINERGRNILHQKIQDMFIRLKQLKIDY